MSSSVNLPQLLAVILVSGILVRYFYMRSSSSASSASTFPGSSSSNSASSRRSRAADPRHVEQIAQMFPQVSRREIIWDLQRNGGSVAATSERILSGVGLERPPPSFQPPSVPLSASTPVSASTSTPPPQQDLISRYNLSSKLQSQPQVISVAEGKKAGWSANKNERQALLQRRREEMILSARRKLEEKDRQGKVS